MCHTACLGEKIAYHGGGSLRILGFSYRIRYRHPGHSRFQKGLVAFGGHIARCHDMKAYVGIVERIDHRGIKRHNVSTVSGSGHKQIIEIEAAQCLGILHRFHFHTDYGLSTQTLTGSGHRHAAAVVHHHTVHFEFFYKLHIVVDYEKSLTFATFGNYLLCYFSHINLVIKAIVRKFYPAAATFNGHPHKLGNAKPAARSCDKLQHTLSVLKKSQLSVGRQFFK